VSAWQIFLSSSLFSLLVVACRTFLFCTSILYVYLSTSVPLHSQCGYHETTYAWFMGPFLACTYTAVRIGVSSVFISR
jgi:hypothetical protein